MSAPNEMAERPSRGKLDKGIRKFKIVNRFVQSDAAGIKPGEDALSLHNRTGYRRAAISQARARSPAGAHSSLPLQGPLRAPGAHPLRHGSISSDYSATSLGSGGSSSTTATRSSGSGSNSSCASLARRVDALSMHHHLNHAAHPYASDASFPGIHSQHSSPLLKTLDEQGHAMKTYSDAAILQATATMDMTLPGPEIAHSEPIMHHLQYRFSHCSDTGITPSDVHIMDSPLGSPGAVPPDSPMPPPSSVPRIDPASFPMHQSPNSKKPLSVPHSAPSSVVEMSRENSSHGAAADNGNAGGSPYEHNDEVASNNTIRESSEPSSSAASSDQPSTPPPENDEEDSEDNSSEHESESPSDDSRESPDPLQRDFLEELLRPVKRHLFQRLMLYVANNRNLGISLPTAPLFGCTGVVKTEFPDPLTSLPLMQKDFPKQEASQECDRHFLAAGPKETPASTDPGASSSRANGKKPCMPASGQASRTDMGNNRKRKCRSAGSPADDDDGNDSDNEDKRRRAPKPRRSPSPHNGHRHLRIACPYFKRNPYGTPKADACFHTGFREIAKLKEHLDRVHDGSIQCPRCFKLFKKQDEVAAHLRVAGEEMCVQVQEQPHKDVFNASQASELKVKGRMRGHSIEEKWRTIWRILFPSDQEHTIPSPWWVDRDQLLGSSFYRRYENFLRNDLPPRLEQGLTALVDQLFYLEPIHDFIERVVHDCLEQSYAHFRGQDTGQPPTVPRQHEEDAPAEMVPATASSSAGFSTAPHNPGVLPPAASSYIDPSFTMIDATTNHGYQPRSLQQSQDGSTPAAFSVHALPQGQHVDVPNGEHSASLLTTPRSTQLEETNDAPDLMTSYLNVALDGSAEHNPSGRSPIDQWATTDFDDYSSGYHERFSR
ncbi:uncharacterized protein BKCO1_5000034 [Diplodia corticola]|uniref:C2H2-type domain-containing protein n=1 Tax=Diplodia corticola TaxID=236234 RepID=A0A1J9RTS9_9PEZI|nr:uncharacterized protein BKCO1_5000034 [Diplodia corticola]OJD31276.1 hypothetical protein BKCO1_5000034 [Diplodia corticola]